MFLSLPGYSGSLSCQVFKPLIFGVRWYHQGSGQARQRAHFHAFNRKIHFKKAVHVTGELICNASVLTVLFVGVCGGMIQKASQSRKGSCNRAKFHWAQLEWFLAS